MARVCTQHSTWHFPTLPGLAHIAAAVEPLQGVASLRLFIVVAVGNGARLHRRSVRHADGGRLNAEKICPLLQLLERVEPGLSKVLAVDVFLVEGSLL